MGGSLNDNEIDELLNMPVYRDQIVNFVETGTYKGVSTMAAAKKIKNVYTIEICKELYETTKQDVLSKGFTNIEFIFGDSITELPSIMEKISKTNGGSIYFIDAHASGGDSSWNFKNRVPIFEELELILNYKIKPSIFIIDDLRLWKNNTWDWCHISNEKLLSFFNEKGVKVWMSYEKNDRFYILTI